MKLEDFENNLSESEFKNDEELEKKIEEIKNNLPEGAIMTSDPKQIIYHVVIIPEVERILNSEHKCNDEIEETLIELLDFFEEFGLANDEIKLLIELLKKIDEELADLYLFRYEEIINNF